ncbi:hypothetical protein DFH09DRAFT_1129307 [Mycena vulgaris]|nr:hypothetical protein DFH09DRAFT_1129307 [Mycena vulgaris]
MIESLPSNLADVVKTSQVSRRLRLVASDTILNVWRLPILRTLHSTTEYEDALKNLSVYMSVPRHNWVDILALARASYILFEATLPNLKEAEWEEAFKRRFLPSWTRWRKDSLWKATFLRVLHQTWHRTSTCCTTNEAWTKYIVLNRNGSANLLESSSRNFNPIVVFDDLRMQQNMHHLDMQARLVVQFADVRVPRTWHSQSATDCARHLHIFSFEITTARLNACQLSLLYPGRNRQAFGSDSDELEEAGMQWDKEQRTRRRNWPPLQDHDLVVGSGRQQYASLTWDDFWTIAPWLEEKITRQIDGPGLGI